ncbi:MAG TPA: tetratricopeptide repeat protein, partial [Janthinobacterium sp.]|nr:tetratricopeptide repeat protein [Janthinobacterium sp.]
MKKSNIRAAEAASSSDAMLKLERALALHRQGEVCQAGALYRDILMLEPDNFNALHLLGAFALQSGDIQAAYELITRAAAIAPQLALVHLHRGVALQGLQRYGEALLSYRRALRIDPGQVDANFNEGLCLLLNGDLEAGW